MASGLPNIVIFNPDQWRGDVLGHMGNPAAVTPNLDRVAAEDGVSFRNAYCQNPMCTPSRCSFMSGWYPHVRGHRTMSCMMRPDEPVLLRTLKRNGYHVWWGGKNDLVPGQGGYEAYCTTRYATPPEEEAKGYLRAPDNWRGPRDGDNFFSFHIGRLEHEGEEYTDGDWSVVRGARDFVRRYDGEEPFCLFLALGFPHPPYGVEEPWYGMIDRSRIPERFAPEGIAGNEPALYEEIRSIQRMGGWTEERWAQLRATYYGMCARVDHQFGLLMDALREAGVYDDTAVFFFPDHGDFTGDYGVVQKADNLFQDCLSRVPLVIKPPSSLPVKPRISDALVELIDMPATVEELTGIRMEQDHFGQSLLPVLSGEKEEHRDAVFCEGGRRYFENQCKGLELIPEPYEENLYWSVLKSFRTDAPACGKAVMLRTRRYKYVQRLYEEDELYDLVEDPGETHNRVHDPALSEELASLRARMLRWHLETNDIVPREIDSRGGPWADWLRELRPKLEKQRVYFWQPKG